MAKIDVSRIDGYEGMSAEQKLAALESYEFEAPVATESSDVTKLKASLSRANSEAADYKRQLREKQTEAERDAAERAESDKAIQEELQMLRRERLVASYEKQCLGLGYDSELAASTAQAMVDGRFNDVFAAQKTFLENKQKSLEAAALNRQPELMGGKPLSKEMIEAQETAKLRKAFGLPN